jgi:hypothetical protein
LEAAHRVARGADGVFVTSITDPANSNFLRWWAAYRDGDAVVFQEQICFLAELSEEFNPERPEPALRPRETKSEDGQPRSEWVVDVAALIEFAVRRAH